MIAMLRKYLIAGLLVWVPLGATVVIVKLVIDMMDMLWLLLPETWQPEALWGFVVPGTGLLLALVVLILTGFLAANLIGRRLVALWEAILGRIPLVRNIYTAFKQITNSFLTSDKRSFSKVVLVEFPGPGTWNIGFVTNENLQIEAAGLPGSKVCVFLPTTPVPTIGYNLIMAPEKLIELDMSVEEAFQMIMSMGVVMPERRIRELAATRPVAQSPPGS